MTIDEAIHLESYDEQWADWFIDEQQALVRGSNEGSFHKGPGACSNIPTRRMRLLSSFLSGLKDG
ncbi:hypothetical protein AWU65_15355 [Paenibacillus glucanolyticus]|uniref:Uncharacterized protein n=1 Tax=Paenibacillus glucanolyticus TaxID=59843 RepID=A0A163KGE7_9BACL|nr:hypothetical protein [Paenibacillus glucanolyticus]KZS47206.1 hypothetical protein AWU65_15355 [Paenibacillus glucanolyticus]